MNSDKVKLRLKALLATARSKGSSMAEVSACMERAQKIMAEHGLTEADIASAQSADFEDQEIFMRDGVKNFSPIDRYIGNAIARFCGVKVYVSSTPLNGGTGANTTKRRVIYFGLSADVDLAMFIRGALIDFMNDQWEAYKRHTCYGMRVEDLKRERIGFIQGYCRTVSARLTDMTFRKDGEGSGTDLVVSKLSASADELSKRGVNIDGNARMKGDASGSATGAGAGVIAGNSASVGRGVGAGGARMLT